MHRAPALAHGPTVLARLYDHIDAAASSHRVLEHKGKVILTLAKRPTRDNEYLTWPRLHFGASTAGAEMTVPPIYSQRAKQIAEAPQLPQLTSAAARGRR